MPQNTSVATEPPTTVFLCANCARPGQSSTARFGRPSLPIFPWKSPVQEVVVPCSGRLQPEHLLKAFEAGADLVAVVACQEGNCHYLEGSCRARQRCKYVGDLLEQIGLGRARLMLFHLPGSAGQDMAVGVPQGSKAAPVSDAALTAQINVIAGQVAQALATLPPTPLRERAAALEDIDLSDVEATEENED